MPENKSRGKKKKRIRGGNKTKKKLEERRENEIETGN